MGVMTFKRQNFPSQLQTAMTNISALVNFSIVKKYPRKWIKEEGSWNFTPRI